MTDQPRNDEPLTQGWQAPDSSFGYAPEPSQAPIASPYGAAQPSPQWDNPNGDAHGQYPPSAQSASSSYGTDMPPTTPGSSYSTPYDQNAGAQQHGAADQQPNAAWAPAPQPGIIPLRPLTIGDLFDGTFRAIRSNPTVMFGFAVAVMAVLSLVSAFMTWYSVGTLFNYLEDPAAMQGDDIEATAAFVTSSLLSALVSTALNVIAVMILSGMLALTVTDAVLGHMTTIEHAWERIRPRVWKLLGLSLLVSLISGAVMVAVFAIFGGLGVALYAATESIGLLVALGIFLGLPIMTVAAFYVQVKLVFAPVILAIEGQGVITSIKRSFALTQGSFWRVLGRLLLITLVTSFVGGILGGVAGIFQGILPLLVSEAMAIAIGTFLTGLMTALLIPVSSAFQTLMYIDERIRKENLAPALIQASQAQ